MIIGRGFMSKTTTLQEKYVDDQVNMLLEAISPEDISSLAKVFTDIEKVIANVPMPEIDTVLDGLSNNLSLEHMAYPATFNYYT